MESDCKGETMKDAQDSCVSRKIEIFASEHPDWEHDHVIAAAEGWCREHKNMDTEEEKAMSAIDATAGGALADGGKEPEKGEPKEKEYKLHYQIDGMDGKTKNLPLEFGQSPPEFSYNYHIRDDAGGILDRRLFKNLADAEKFLTRIALR